MADADQFKDKILGFLRGMTLGQKMTISTTLIVGILGFVFLFRWATQPDYALLFSNLDLKEADQIVESLRAQNVPYKLSAGGSSVLIPSRQIYEWRVTLAAQGLPSAGSIGYEIFDQNEIGLSNFVQKINYRRALEGELSRTIESIKGITKARVHIVIPEDRLFRKDQNDPTASIVLHMSTNRRLRDEQVEGIANLVSAGVEGLHPGNVKIVDSRGRTLSGAYSMDSIMGMTSSQLDVQRRVEAHLTQKAQSMLSAVLGEGHSHIRVTANLDFQRIEQTSENYDPNNTAILSEERSEKSNQGQQNVTGQSEYFTTNYNVPTTVEHIVNAVGGITQLSISVVVDHFRRTMPDINGVMVDSVRQRLPEEMNALENIVKNAIGFNEDRDQFEIANLAFDTSDEPLSVEPDFLFGIDGQYIDLVQKVLPVLFLFLFLMIIKGRLKKMKLSAPSGIAGTRQLRAAGGAVLPGESTEAVPLPRIDEEGLSPEGAESAKLLQQISDFVDEKPSAAVKLIRYWLLEE
ncbi:flagellar M-ring protein FliF [bacterium]|nr:flagellar M-ring protein FliF [bacterium]